MKSLVFIASLHFSAAVSAQFALHLFFNEDEADEGLVEQLRRHKRVGKAGIHIFTHEMPEEIETAQLEALQYLVPFRFPESDKGPVDIPGLLFIATNMSSSFYSMPWWELAVEQRNINQKWVRYRHFKKISATAVVRFVTASVPHEFDPPVGSSEATTEFISPSRLWRRHQIRSLDDFASWCLSNNPAGNRVCVILICKTKSPKQKGKRVRADANWKILGRVADKLDPQHASFSFMWVQAESTIHKELGLKDSPAPTIELLHPTSSRIMMYPDPKQVAANPALVRSSYFAPKAAQSIEAMLKMWDIPKNHFNEWMAALKRGDQHEL